MGASLYQPSFIGGELSPSMMGRTDLSRYQIGLATCRNFIVQQYGGVKNRPGTRYIAQTKTQTDAGGVVSPVSKVRLIPFAFNVEQSYVLEFGHQYVRVYRDGALLVGGSGLPVEVVYGGSDTLWNEADLPLLKYTQSADVLTVCHPSHPPKQIKRYGEHIWRLEPFAHENGPFRDANFDEASTIYASAATGTVTLTASVASTFVDDHVGTLIELTQKDYGKPWETGKAVALNDIRRADGKYYKATNAGTTGTLRPSHDADTASDGTVEWLFLHPGFGVARITSVLGVMSVEAQVLSRLPDDVVGVANGTYKWALGAWGKDTGYPSCTTYFQERQVFAATPSQPQTVWMSKTGNYLDFGRSTPSVDDDAVTFTIAEREANAVRHLVPLDKLVILTSGSEWIVAGGDNGVVTPAAVNAKLQGYRGSSHRPPLTIGNSVLYLQAKGSMVRDLGYDFASDSYTGGDLTLTASHLTEGKRIVDWAFQQVPGMTAWAVRADGALLGMTYLKDQQVAGWHRHDTDGTFESVCCVSEGDEDAVYVIVKRGTMRLIERFASRRFATVADACLVDSAVSIDLTNTTTITITVTGGTTWGPGETLTMTATGGVFDPVHDIGDDVVFMVDGSQYRLRIQTVSSVFEATATPNRVLPVSLRAVATTSWAATYNFIHMPHLIGKNVVALAEGRVVHPALPVQADGYVELASPAYKAQIGLPYTADFETLDANITGETIRDKPKVVQAVRFLLESSRGLWAGPDAAHLTEYKLPEPDPYALVPTFTGQTEMRVTATWNKGGRVFVRQSDPLPLHILAVIPDLALGGS